jgi:tyrosinase
MILTCCPCIVELTNFIADASDFVNSTFWDPDPTTAVGGWGDPNDDYRVPNGGFATGFPLSYPLPHRLRREYQGSSFPDFLNEIKPANVAAMVNGFVGTFIGFQAFLENGPHTAIHSLVGACVGLLISLSFRLLTGPTQGSRGAVPRKRPR